MGACGMAVQTVAAPAGPTMISVREDDYRLLQHLFAECRDLVFCFQENFTDRVVRHVGEIARVVNRPIPECEEAVMQERAEAARRIVFGE